MFLALLPLAFNYLKLEMRGQGASLEKILDGGELLLVAAAISAAAIGDLIGGGGKDRGVLKLIAAGGSVLVLALASMQFADLAAAKADPLFNPEVVVTTSQFFFVCAVVAGAGCIALGEG